MPHVMQSATTPLLLFLGRAKRTFLAGPAAAGAVEPRALVYIGNAAGDLDTIVSSLTAAFVREQLPAGDLGAASGAPGAPGAAGAPEAALHVPVLPFARADFRLRQDASLLFAHCGFEMDGQGAPSELLFWDEVSAELAGAWRDAGLGLVLTDHNALTPAVGAALGQQVCGIIDHHQDEGKHLDTCDGDARRIDTSAGSACSLVAHEAAAVAACQEDVTLSTLLLATIAADCRGFDPKQRRFDWADVTAAHGLLQQLQQQQVQQLLQQAPDYAADPNAAAAAATAASATRDAVFDMFLKRDAAAVDSAAATARAAALPTAATVGGAESIGALGDRLLKARFDVSALSAADLLKLDYKPASGGGFKVGVAAIFVSLPEFTVLCESSGGLAATMRAFAEQMGEAIVVEP